MIRDEELRSSADYSEGQTEAARRVLVELVNLFDEMKVKLGEKFASIDHAGPKDVADFLEAEDEEQEQIIRDAYEQVQALLSQIG